MEFRFETLVQQPRHAVFAFHENPANLAVLHQGWSRLRVLHHDGSLRPDNETWVENTLAGILPVVLGFRHSGLDAPHWFEETLIHGPLRRFVHRHEFEARGDVTLVRDAVTVEFHPHFGGVLAMRLCGARMVRHLFAQRCAAMVRLAQSGVLSGCRATASH